MRRRCVAAPSFSYCLFILNSHKNLSSVPAGIVPYCVVVLDGRQPICVLRLVWRNSHTEHFSIFLWEFSINYCLLPHPNKSVFQKKTLEAQAQI